MGCDGYLTSPLPLCWCLQRTTLSWIPSEFSASVPSVTYYNLLRNALLSVLLTEGLGM